jgi:hypothetical protein
MKGQATPAEHYEGAFTIWRTEAQKMLVSVP